MRECSLQDHPMGFATGAENCMEVRAEYPTASNSRYRLQIPRSILEDPGWLVLTANHAPGKLELKFLVSGLVPVTHSE